MYLILFALKEISPQCWMNVARKQIIFDKHALLVKPNPSLVIIFHLKTLIFLRLSWLCCWTEGWYRVGRPPGSKPAPAWSRTGSRKLWQNTKRWSQVNTHNIPLSSPAAAAQGLFSGHAKQLRNIDKNIERFFVKPPFCKPSYFTATQKLWANRSGGQFPSQFPSRGSDRRVCGTGCT